MTTLHECHVVVDISDDEGSTSMGEIRNVSPLLWVGTNWNEAVEAAEDFSRYRSEIQTWIGSERTNRYRNVQNEWVTT